MDAWQCEFSIFFLYIYIYSHCKYNVSIIYIITMKQCEISLILYVIFVRAMLFKPNNWAEFRPNATPAPRLAFGLNSIFLFVTHSICL